MAEAKPTITAAVLWAPDALVAAAQAQLDGVIASPITGFSIDTRSITAGDVFVALKDARDGHDFVNAAFKAGAAAALVAATYVRKPGDGALIRVDDPLRALERIGIAARARLSPQARVIAVTGSVGKTGTKEMLRACLTPQGATHAADKSFNNHWGVPLTLARMPAATRFGVFEIGMNHPGEITPLARMVRPHVAIITTVEPVHLAAFASVEEIADAKAEIFDGLEPGKGIAILNHDNPHYTRLAAACKALNTLSFSFGRAPDAYYRASSIDADADGSTINVALAGLKRFTFRVGAPGAHLAQNSLAVVAALDAVGADLARALPVLAHVTAPQGRGARTILATGDGELLLIDESYNANPASMRAALAAMATVPRPAAGVVGQIGRRRIVVLGDMLELGPQSQPLHRSLSAAIEAADVDLVFAAGPHMQALHADVCPSARAVWAERSDGLVAPILAEVRAGDVIMVKGSLGSRMAVVVDALTARFRGEARIS
jgi:UDP-N-acetylmuramoyl-tripeptide--D-alanyl-D-alanine ligase